MVSNSGSFGGSFRVSLVGSFRWFVCSSLVGAVVGEFVGEVASPLLGVPSDSAWLLHSPMPGGSLATAPASCASTRCRSVALVEWVSGEQGCSWPPCESRAVCVSCARVHEGSGHEDADAPALGMFASLASSSALPMRPLMSNSLFVISSIVCACLIVAGQVSASHPVRLPHKAQKTAPSVPQLAR